MVTARSSGDRGDTLYSLPVIRYYGGGVLYCEAATYTRERLTWERWQSLVPLLKAQEYITDVQEWMGQSVTLNLNDFRSRMFKELKNPNTPLKSKSLASWICETHAVPLTELDRAWLTVPEKKREAPVVFNRSTRYHNPLFPWRQIVDRYGKDAVFIGHSEEHAAFTRLFGHVAYLPTATFLDAAQVIAGADLFVGNQSACYACCEGLKQNAILECWPDGRNCLFYRKGLAHGIDGAIYYPALAT